jgi:hypothetical protein
MNDNVTQANKNGDNIQGHNVNVNKSRYETKRDILNDLHRNIDKLNDLYTFNNSIPNSGNKLNYMKILGITIFSAIVFWFLAVLSYKFFKFEISSTNVILTLVGILATFIVISNYLQVKEIKDEFYNHSKNIEANIRNIVIENINEYKHSVTATILHLQGYISYTEKASSDALEYYMKALDELNRATNKDMIDNIIVNLICVLTDDNVIRISKEQRKEYRNIIIKCGHEDTDEILGYIDYIEILEFP